MAKTLVVRPVYLSRFLPRMRSVITIVEETPGVFGGRAPREQGAQRNTMSFSELVVDGVMAAHIDSSNNLV